MASKAIRIFFDNILCFSTHAFAVAIGGLIVAVITRQTGVTVLELENFFFGVIALLGAVLTVAVINKQILAAQREATLQRQLDSKLALFEKRYHVLTVASDYVNHVFSGNTNERSREFSEIRFQSEFLFNAEIRQDLRQLNSTCIEIECQLYEKKNLQQKMPVSERAALLDKVNIQLENLTKKMEPFLKVSDML